MNFHRTNIKIIFFLLLFIITPWLIKFMGLVLLPDFQKMKIFILLYFYSVFILPALVLVFSIFIIIKIRLYWKNCLKVFLLLLFYLFGTGAEELVWLQSFSRYEYDYLSAAVICIFSLITVLLSIIIGVIIVIIRYKKAKQI